MSDSVQPHRWKPTRLPCPWDSPGKNAGVGCHFLLQCMKVKSERSLSRVRLFETLWTAAQWAPPSMGFSRQKYWSGVPLSPLNNSMRQMLLSSHSTDEPNRVQWIKYFDQDQWEMAQPRDSKACWRWKSFLFVPVSGPYCLYISCLTEQRLTLILGSMANIPSSH